jgi:hypothetical protein
VIQKNNISGLAKIAVTAGVALLMGGCSSGGGTAESASAAVAAPERPDFTGLWMAARGQRGASGFGNQQGGLPLTDEGKRRVEEYRKLLGPENANPAAYCVDYGTPLVMEQPGGYPLEFIQKGDQLTIIYEVENETRRIYMGDRQLPVQERVPSRAGYSQGRWEGDVLVVTTTDLLDGRDQGAHPHSDQATIEERFSFVTDDEGRKLMNYEASIIDPVYYTEPFKIQRRYQPLEDGFILPYRCPDDFWYELLDMRTEQLKQGKPANAAMSDVYKSHEAKY